MKKMSESLKEFRTKNRLTIKECADVIGISSSTYRDWEYGRAISGEPYLKIAELFGITISELFGQKLNEGEKKLIELEKNLNMALMAVKSIKLHL